MPIKNFNNLKVHNVFHVVILFCTVENAAVFYIKKNRFKWSFFNVLLLLQWQPGPYIATLKDCLWLFIHQMVWKYEYGENRWLFVPTEFWYLQKIYLKILLFFKLRFTSFCQILFNLNAIRYSWTPCIFFELRGGDAGRIHNSARRPLTNSSNLQHFIQ